MIIVYIDNYIYNKIKIKAHSRAKMIVNINEHELNTADDRLSTLDYMCDFLLFACERELMAKCICLTRNA